MAYQLNLNWPEFLEKYWQKQPVVLKNAFPNFVDPITPDELAGLAMEPEVDSRLVSHFNGKWQASNGPFEHFDDLGETGWSLLAQAVNHWHMPAAELVRPFRVLPDWRLDDLMISFSVPGGGVGPHIDQYDVFIIQGMGSRRWRVGTSCRCVSSARIRRCCTSIRLSRSSTKIWPRAISSTSRLDSRTTALPMRRRSTTPSVSAGRTVAI
jgi:ribosomal protein L16 Arg81 hydroxylase